MSDDLLTPNWILALIGPHYDPCPLYGAGGLERDWPTDQLVFINPPYSDPLPWVKKAAAHKGRILLLLKLDPSTEWYQYSKFFRVIPITSRIKFDRTDGGPAMAAPFPSVLWERNGGAINGL
jgi:DNA N-6-adenine-methyltransferase (Dam)